MYNEPIKQAFLRESKPASVEGRHSVFKNSENTEKFYDEDLYNFSIDQIEEIFMAYQATSIEYLDTIRSHIKNYIDWAIHKGYRQSNIHPMDGFSKDDLEKYLVKEVQRFFSEEQIEDIIENACVTYQDKALIRVIYEGAMGANLSEIIKLTKSDIDEENKIISLKDDGTGIRREIQVTDKCIELLLNASEETRYIHSKEGAKEWELIPSPYVFKNVKARRTKYEIATPRLIRARFAALKETLGYYLFSPSEISLSGQIRYAAEIYKRKGKLKIPEKYVVAKRFGKGTKVDENGEKILNYNLVREITLESVEETYDIDKIDHFTFPIE